MGTAKSRSMLDNPDEAIQSEENPILARSTSTGEQTVSIAEKTVEDADETSIIEDDDACMQSRAERDRLFTLACIMGAIGGLANGYNVNAAGAILEHLHDDIEFDRSLDGLVVASVFVGCAAGC